MHLAAFIQKASTALEALYPAPESRNIALLLCRERLGISNYTHITEPMLRIDEKDEACLEKDLGRLLCGEPVQYVLGQTEFYGRTFKVDGRVLIPRPETELLVQEAENLIRSLGGAVRVLDLCTGSGCIAWSVALDCPAAEVTAVDISEDALQVAGSQFASPNAPTFVKADMLDRSIDFGRFDLLLSNPPYIMDKEKALMRRNVLDYEPELALFVPDADPLVFYKAIAEVAERSLVDEGSGIVEINEMLGPETAQAFIDAGLKDVRVLKDLSGKDRFVRFVKQL